LEILGQGVVALKGRYQQLVDYTIILDNRPTTGGAKSPTPSPITDQPHELSGQCLKCIGG